MPMLDISFRCFHMKMLLGLVGRIVLWLVRNRDDVRVGCSFRTPAWGACGRVGLLALDGDGGIA